MTASSSGKNRRFRRRSQGRRFLFSGFLKKTEEKPEIVAV
jgi:hypothetical protein